MLKFVSYVSCIWQKLMKANNERLSLEEAERKEQELSVGDKEMAERLVFWC